MIKKTLTILVILSLLGVSTAYAYTPEDDHRNDQAVAITAIITFTVITVVYLLAGHDRPGGPPHHPWHLSFILQPDPAVEPDRPDPADHRHPATAY